MTEPVKPLVTHEQSFLVQPDSNCPHCPRLVALRARLRGETQGWHNAPVPGFGPLEAKLLIVGLAPGLKGANRTGRPFTGDYAGELLFATLASMGLAQGAYRGGRDDGKWPGDDLRLIDTRITNAVRCLPPDNKPLPAEINRCGSFLKAEIAAMARLRAILALGRVAHDAVLRALGMKPRAAAFAHGAVHELGALALTDSYHCSRYNTNTGRLTPAMFEAAVRSAAARAGSMGGRS